MKSCFNLKYDFDSGDKPSSSPMPRREDADNRSDNQKRNDAYSNDNHIEDFLSDLLSRQDNLTQAEKSAPTVQALIGLASKWEVNPWEVVESIKPKHFTEDPYELAIKNNKYRYTCRAGWIDKTHFSTPTKREFVGVENLWNQILHETGMNSSIEPDKGFRVAYRQDAKVTDLLAPIGVTKTYFVAKGLNIQQKEQVALAIFQEVSEEFEDMQGLAFWSGSSFEPADLISNLLGFYHVVRGYSEQEIFEKCEMLSIEESLEIYKKYPGTFTDSKYKNKKWTPRYFPNKYCGGNCTFPEEFQSIIPAQKGEMFRNWTRLDYDKFSHGKEQY